VRPGAEDYFVLGNICSEKLSVLVRLFPSNSPDFSFSFTRVIESLGFLLEGNVPPIELTQGYFDVDWQFRTAGMFFAQPSMVALAVCGRLPANVSVSFEYSQDRSYWEVGKKIVLVAEGRVLDGLVEVSDVDVDALRILAKISSDQELARAERLAILKENRRPPATPPDGPKFVATIWNDPKLANQALVLGLIGISRAWYHGSPCISGDGPQWGCPTWEDAPLKDLVLDD